MFPQESSHGYKIQQRVTVIASSAEVGPPREVKRSSRSSVELIGYNDFYRHPRGNVMSVTTFEGVIENGQIRLPAGVVLPERQIVFVVVPDVVQATIPKVPGVRLANLEDAERFEMKVTWENDR
jgi:hypothetical protein